MYILIFCTVPEESQIQYMFYTQRVLLYIHIYVCVCVCVRVLKHVLNRKNNSDTLHSAQEIPN